MKLVGVAIMSFSLAWIAAHMIARYGLRWGLGDVPNKRSSHTSIVPKGGGLGIPVAVAFTSIFFPSPQLLVAGASVLIAIIAFLNDRKGFSVGIRLLVETFAAGVLMYPVFVMGRTFNGFPLAAILFLASILYVVAQANFFNFMDGINGIAAIEAIISFSLLGAFAQLNRKPDVLLISVAVVAGAIGFLPLNFPGAKVFMGDVGSLFLGFLFAVLVVRSSGSLKNLLALALFQGVFSIDCMITMIRRARKRENLLRAHRQHLYQRMVHFRGWSHARTSLAFGGVQAVFGVAALFFYSSSIVVLMLLWLGLLIIYIYSATHCVRGMSAIRDC